MTVLPPRPSIAVFLNSYWVFVQGMSGGDEMAFQIFSRIREKFPNICIYSNSAGVTEANKKGLRNFSMTPQWFDRCGLVPSYILRTIYRLFSIAWMQHDVLYSGSDFFPDVVPAWVFKKTKKQRKWIQCVFHLYPNWRTRPGNLLINYFAYTAQLFSLRLASSADIVLTINTQVRDALLARGFSSKKIVVIHPGVDFIKTQVKTEYVPDVEIYDAIFVGRLNYSKGIFDLPVIWSFVKGLKDGARLGIIGGGNPLLHAELMRQITALGLQRDIDVLGFVQTEKMYSLLRKTKVFVFPSHEEGFGIVLVEALAFGLPIVSWNLPVYQELFGEVISVVPLGDHSEFAASVVSWLNRGTNQAERSAAQNVARRYGWDGIGEIMENLLLRK